MTDQGLMTLMAFQDSEGNRYTFPAGVWLWELMKSLPPEWRDELCHSAAELAKKLEDNAKKPKIYVARS